MGRRSPVAGTLAAGMAQLSLNAMVPPLESVRWMFKRSDDGPTEWFWDDWGAPALDELQPVRIPRSSKKNRHLPVTAFSMTMEAHLELESGLEHDLLRVVDRDPTVRLIVAQPLRLERVKKKSGSRSRMTHTPDLLTARADGEVTLWDARAEEKVDDDFRLKAELTRRCCRDVGWRYQHFSGLTNVQRLNLLWLHGFRRRPPWADDFEGGLRSAAAAGNTTVEVFRALDDGTGRAISTFWHLVWRGDLGIDVSAPITTRSVVTSTEGRANV